MTPDRRPGGDRIEVRGLRLDAVHGVLQEERAAPQPFEIDLDLYLDTAPAASTDDLAATADYAAAAEAAAAVMAGPPHRLLESLAGAVAAAVLADARVDSVTVVVRKLRPPLPHALGSTGVRIHRRRPVAAGSGGPVGPGA
ncbi:MAG TPA: dihydroneopterin aldolase [Acidimicrobiales bacterium]|nr:dihydroneopterin aldolase [Acidimicrobiales bacterium]